MDKLDKYLTSLAGGKDSENIIRSSRSSYYKFGKVIVRVSDHIGANSSGSISLIKTENPNYFVCHRHCNGSVTVITYKEAKQLAKSMRILSSIYYADIPNFQLEKSVLDLSINSKSTILGFSQTNFTKAQINAIKGFIAQNKNNRK